MEDTKFEELLKDIKKNPEKIIPVAKDFSDTQVSRVRKELNPYGVIIADPESKFTHTCLSHTNLREDYLRQLLTTGIISFINRAIDEEETSPIPEFTPAECASMKKFMLKYFKYNPDIHVKSAYKENKADPERHELTEEEKELVPPEDTFHRMKYYMEVNYEKLRQATCSIYREKPDLELAFQIYGHFEGESEANKFQKKYGDEVLTNIDTIQHGKWVLTGPFKENRDRIDFYNENTEIIKQILEHKKEEAQLGKELMEDRVTKGKARNIKENGPDSPGLKDHIANISGISRAGVARGTSVESRKKMEDGYDPASGAGPLEDKETVTKRIAEQNKRIEESEKRDFDAQDGAPSNGIAVKVFTTDGKKMESSYFYTKEKDVSPDQIEQR
jgi:hypothetical protein